LKGSGFGVQGSGFRVQGSGKELGGRVQEEGMTPFIEHSLALQPMDHE